MSLPLHVTLSVQKRRLARTPRVAVTSRPRHAPLKSLSKILSGIAFVCLGCAVASSADLSRIESRGLLITLEISKDAATWSDIEVTARVINKSASDVPYTLGKPDSKDFCFSLVGRNGLVPFSIAGRRFMMFWDFDPTTWIYRGQLRPQEEIACSCKVADLFDIDDPSGCILRVRWDRGMDARGSRYPPDFDLLAEITLPARQALGKRPNQSPQPTQAPGPRG